MRDQNAQQLLATVMDWKDEDSVIRHVPTLQLLADYKYDQYQRFGPGKRFVESLALWLRQFEPADRATALGLVMDRLVYVSDAEFSHLVKTAYPDHIAQERMRLVADEQGIPTYRITELARHARTRELAMKSLYLGLSDGARTNELRRASDGEIGNEQIWHAHELGPDKVEDMLAELRSSLAAVGNVGANQRFNLIWLLDDFSGSGHTYIRFDAAKGSFKGKLTKVYNLLHQEKLVDAAHYEVYLLLYLATRQAIDHIEYWAERFTADRGYKPLQLRVLSILERDVAITSSVDPLLASLTNRDKYYDEKAFDRHMAVGGSVDAKLGFASCALPLVLSHNTPNNSIYILWGPEFSMFPGLFPRVSRHREF